jgi:hypothetical protein
LKIARGKRRRKIALAVSNSDWKDREIGAYANYIILVDMLAKSDWRDADVRQQAGKTQN